MDNKRTIIVVAVIAVVVIAAVAMMMLNGGSDNSDSGKAGGRVGDTITESSFPNVDSRLWVYGNVNEDDYINDEDISYLEGIISGKNKATQLADVNADGTVDAKDVDYLRSILKAMDDSSMELDVYYIDNYFKIAKVSWPVHTIGTSYCSGVYTCEVTGLTDKVKMVDTTIRDYWSRLNSSFASADHFGSTEAPNYESIIKSGIDVYVPGYCVAGTDELSISSLSPVGIDVMFMNTADNSGVDYPNEYIDRSILMFGYLLQGDMEQTYEYLIWHDTTLNAMKKAAESIKDEDKMPFMMSRSSPSYITTGTYSITGYNNTNNIHAEWVGIDAVGQHSKVLTKNYNTLDAGQILTVIRDNANNGVLYFMDNEHDGLRGQRDLDQTVKAWAEVLESSPVSIHYLGMAREGGNSPMYVIEMAFYQNVLYPDLEYPDGVKIDYMELMNYYLGHFVDEKENYDKYFDMDNFFKDYGTWDGDKFVNA